MITKRSFNTEGPCIPAEHYMIDALRGMDNKLISLVDDKTITVFGC